MILGVCLKVAYACWVVAYTYLGVAYASLRRVDFIELVM